MKYLLTLIIFIFPFIPVEAQQAHIPGQRAKALNDKAVNVYFKYNKNNDSITSVMRMLDEALAIDSNYLTAWTNKLGFECQLKQYDSALITANRIIPVFPDQTTINFFSGILALKTGHKDDAETTFNKLIKIYDAIPDANDNSDHLKTAQVNKAIALKLTGHDDECKQILVNLSMKEHDLAVRRHISAYITRSKEEIINEWLNNGPMIQYHN